MREWVADVDGQLTAAEALAIDGSDPELIEERSRVLRGGSWLSAGNECRAAARFRAPPVLRRSEFGFRVARSLRR